MSVIPLNQFPSYVSAVRRGDRLDDYQRDYAFLGLDDELRIAGAVPRREEAAPTGYRIRVRQLSLQMFIELCAVRSPFLVGGAVRPEHILQILWRLSPQYDQRNETPAPGGTSSRLSSGDDTEVAPPTVQSRFVASIAHLPFRAAIRSISRYLDRMFVDKPPQSIKGGGTRPDTSLAASLVHELACAYGWSDEQILATPMPRLFQYLRKIQRANNPDLLYHNPTRDKLKGRAFNKIRAHLKLGANGGTTSQDAGASGIRAGSPSASSTEDKQELVPPTETIQP